DAGRLMTFYAKSNFDNGSARLADVFGPRTVNSLWGRCTEGSLRIITERDQPPFSWSAPVLMVYLNGKMLDRVGGMTTVTAELVVPWTAEGNGILEWIAAWDPSALGTATPAPARAALSPVAT